MEVLKKEEKKCPMTGRTLKCFINDCCFLCWHNFLLFDLMLIFKFFISATPLILLTDPRPRKHGTIVAHFVVNTFEANIHLPFIQVVGAKKGPKITISIVSLC